MASIILLKVLTSNLNCIRELENSKRLLCLENLGITEFALELGTYTLTVTSNQLTEYSFFTVIEGK